MTLSTQAHQCDIAMAGSRWWPASATAAGTRRLSRMLKPVANLPGSGAAGTKKQARCRTRAA